MKPEQRLWKTVREHVIHWPKSHWQRIENEVGAGQPDVNYCIDGVEGWLELKVWPRKLEPSQILWARTREACGGITWVLVKASTLMDCLLLHAEDYRVSGNVLDLRSRRRWSLVADGWDALRYVLTIERPVRPGSLAALRAEK